MSSVAVSTPAPSLSAIFFACLKIGLLSFGGGLTGWLYQEFVLKKGWIGEDNFTASMAISQMLPGANVVNLVICMGDELKGIAGATTGLFGFLVGPFFVTIAFCKLFDMLSAFSLLPVVSDGVAFAAIGLLVMMCVHGVRKAFPSLISLSVIAITALLIGVFQFSLIAVVVVVAPISVVAVWRRL